jgi:phytoene synthase
MSGNNPEHAILLSYAPAKGRAALVAALALDAALSDVLRSTSEPVLGQIRLRWWDDSLHALDDGPAAAVPVLADLAQAFAGTGVRPSMLGAMTEGWSMLLEEETFDAELLDRQGQLRGGTLFEACGQVFGAQPGDPLINAGTGWALADLARHVREPELAELAAARARTLLDQALGVRWSNAARSLGAAAHFARMDLDVPLTAPLPTGSPRRLGRVLWHRLTGR